MKLSRLISALVALLTVLPTGNAHGVYDASRGRWLTRDPAGYVDGANLNQYAMSNPNVFRDPSGRALRFGPSNGPFSNSYLSCGGIRCIAGLFYDAPICEGYTRLVAQITLVTTCDCCNGNNTLSTAIYWEDWDAFDIPRMLTRNPLPLALDDHYFTLPGFPNANGAQIAVAEVREFCDPAGQLDGEFDSWLQEGVRTVGRTCCGASETPLGTNEITFAKPWFWDTWPTCGTARQIARSSWECCGCQVNDRSGCHTTLSASCTPGPEPNPGCPIRK